VSAQLPRVSTPTNGRGGPRPSASPIRLLVVDDDQLHARLLRANLQQPARLCVEIATSAAEALEHLAHQIVDAVLADVMTPEMDGI
jgi:CheY-like chemotaxis protein